LFADFGGIRGFGGRALDLLLLSANRRSGQQSARQHQQYCGAKRGRHAIHHYSLDVREIFLLRLGGNTLGNQGPGPTARARAAFHQMPRSEIFRHAPPPAAHKIEIHGPADR